MESSIIIDTKMDVWSMGMTLLELCSPQPLLKTMFERMVEGTGNVSAFFNWLCNTKQKLVLPEEIADFDEDFFDLLEKWMLDKRQHGRRSSYQCLNHPFLRKDVSATEPAFSGSAIQKFKHNISGGALKRGKQPAGSNQADLHGEFWMLCEGGELTNVADWIEIKMILSNAAGTCRIFASNDKKCENVVSEHQLDGLVVQRLSDSVSAKHCAFLVRAGTTLLYLAAFSRDLRNIWVKAMKDASVGGKQKSKSKSVMQRNAQRTTNMKAMRADMKEGKEKKEFFGPKDEKGGAFCFTWLDLSVADELFGSGSKGHGGRFVDDDDDGSAQTVGADGQSVSKQLDQAYMNQATDSWTMDLLLEQLKQHDIDYTQYGQGDARSLDDLLKELKNRDCYFETIDEQLVRLFDAVILKIEDPVGRILMEQERQLSDGRVIGEQQFPAAKRRPEERVLTTACRVLRDKLQMTENDIQFDDDSKNAAVQWEEKESSSYPGIVTIVRKHIVRGKLLQLGLCVSQEMTVEKKDGNKRYFAWTEKNLEKSARISARRSITDQYMPLDSSLIDSDAHTTGASLREILKENGVNMEAFKGDVKEMSQEHLSGNATLMISRSCSEFGVIRVKHVVCMRLIRPEQKLVLVERYKKKADGTLVPASGSFPGKTRNNNETTRDGLKAALRQVGIPEEALSISQKENIMREEGESSRWVGMKTVYFRHIIDCMLVTEDPITLKSLALGPDESKESDGRQKGKRASKRASENDGNSEYNPYRRVSTQSRHG
eukprot:gnl/MRDRNA2_/MRDRNA2_133732_c0_seq1.p1 gnl/MRDRNA2_/MRDRNA2_133732_c0~~gnl/MRDRNA2_/MRDRNA2_133732_c0_seq1.p1  ORF type:complete len:803 (+),score=158.76 gnl/MRDRNA2_/MRDRNA2_133732_c0_seq1:99-2411(+)